MANPVLGEKKDPSGRYRVLVSWSNLGRELAFRPQVRFAALVAAGVAVSTLLIGGEHGLFWGRLLSLTLWILAVRMLFSARRNSVQSEEGQFFGDLAVAFSFLLPLGFLGFFIPDPTAATPFLEPIRTILLVCHDAALLLAVELQPHRRHRWRSARLERMLMVPSVTVFLLGLMAYFLVVPRLLDVAPADGAAVAPLLFSTVALFIAANFLYLTLSAGQIRWRLLYGGVAGVLVLGILRRAGAAAGVQGLPSWGSELVLDTVAGSLVVLMAQLQSFPLTLPGERKLKGDALEENLPGPSGQTLLQALFFPALHFIGYSFSDFFDPALKARREILVGWILLILGILAWIQNRWIERRTRYLWSEHRRLSRKLLERAEDLRLMIERRHAQEAVEAWEERFSRVFSGIPDPTSLATLEEGRYLEVNAGFVSATGWERHEAIGKTSLELGLWRPEEREMIVSRLKRGEKIRGEEIEYRTRSGERRLGLFSTELVEFQSQPAILTMVVDVTDRDGG